MLFLSKFVNVTSIQLIRSNQVTMDVHLAQAMKNLRKLVIDDCVKIAGDVLFQHFPPLLEHLELRRCPSVTFPTEEEDENSSLITFPETLVSVVLVECALLAKNPRFFARLPKSVIRVELSHCFSPCGWMSENMEVLSLGWHDLTEYPMLPRLKRLSLRKCSNDLLEHFADHSTALEALDICECMDLTDGIADALARMKKLKEFFCSSTRLSEVCILEGLCKAGVRLKKLDTIKSQVMSENVLDLFGDDLEMFSYSAICDNLVVSLPVTITSLALDNATISAAGFEHLSFLMRAMKSLSLSGIDSCNDSMLEKLLMEMDCIEALHLVAIPASGVCFTNVRKKKKRFPHLRDFALNSACRKNDWLSDTLKAMPNLESLALEGACLVSFEHLAKHCPFLRVLIISTPGVTALRDPDKWLGKISTLETLKLEFCKDLSQDVMPILPRLGRLSSLSLDTMFDVPLSTLHQCRNLTEIFAYRTLFKLEDVLELSRLDGLCRLQLSLQDNSDENCELVMDQLSQCKTLKELAVLHPATLEPFVTEKYSTRFVLLDRQKMTSKGELAEGGMSLRSLELLREAVGKQREQRGEEKEKTAFMVHMRDEFSVHLLGSLVGRGYRVVCLRVPYSEALQNTLDSELDAKAMELFGEDVDVVYVEQPLETEEQMLELRQRVQSHCVKALDLAVLLWPVERSPEGWMETSRPPFPTLLLQRHWTWRLEQVSKFGLSFRNIALSLSIYIYISISHSVFCLQVFLRPAVLAAALHPLLMKASCPLLALHGYGLGSISENSSGGMYHGRVAFSAAYSVIRSLSYDFKHGIVAGINPGLWAPGCSKAWVAKISEKEFAKRFEDALFSLTPDHSGKMVKFNLEIIPP